MSSELAFAIGAAEENQNEYSTFTTRFASCREMKWQRQLYSMLFALLFLKQKSIGARLNDDQIIIIQTVKRQ